ncbi:TOBE domain-containing protein [soil metagenome]
MPVEDTFLRIGQASALLGVSIDTLRRWDEDGTIAVDRTAGGQRRIPTGEVQRLLTERGQPGARPPIVATSARNQLAGVVTDVVTGAAAATVEVQAGPFRLVALMTAESVRDLGLETGSQVVASVKSTNVVIGLPA